MVSIIRGAVRGAGYVLLALLIPVVTVVTLPVVIVTSASSRWRVARFRNARQGQVFLIWHARRGWYDFMRNNVLPVLPANVDSIQDRRRGGEELRAIHEALARAPRVVRPRPWLVVVGRKRVHCFSLNAALRAKKIDARRDPAVQTRVKEILEQTVEQCALQVEPEEGRP